jgi:CRISPR/Cas system CMR-associated protein Cmr1 (group 7 of RAMP superfamily)
MQGFHSHPSRKCLWSLSLSFSPHLCYQTAKLVRTVGSVVATAKVVRQFQPRVSLLPSNLFVFSFWNKVDSNLHETSCLIDPKFIGEANKPCWANVKLVFELSELRLVKLSSRTRFGPFCSDQITLITRQ